ncbi:peptide-binding protein [Aliivibrio fischeri]|uniref:SgrR family transcriptional regulator n=1 Tax=Aliivibrio fischeri TaxID=668 RepID=UPI0012D87BD9|nr:SgrR family transcriptional regulator [Aliivibrio fischeri]MUK38648.1 peptide-binding protein [Aliivibrio fischeri]MUL06149.1 peptide-binding protein [Aliivibrio fischeri]
MIEGKLAAYYFRMVELGVRTEVLITLNEVADLVFTSARHCRTILKEMSQLGWLEWHPKVGRNQRSVLYLNYHVNELKSELAKAMISNGKYEKALALIDHDHVLFGALLQNTSGVVRREGELHIQLTYPRSFSALLPHCSLRNSERFLLRQVYCCLTECDFSGKLSSQLAHHWTYDEQAYRWRFYLRPQLYFHDGSMITAECVAELFQKLKELPEYQDELEHVTAISAPNTHCIEFKLNQPDLGFAGLLADARYSIQPVSQLSSSKTSIGCGFFQVDSLSDTRLQLQAFERYYGCRALVDSVTIWKVAMDSLGKIAMKSGQVDLDQKVTCTHYLEKSQDNKKMRSNEVRTRIEDGCLLALFNHSSELSLLQRKYLSQILSPNKLQDEVIKSGEKIEAVPAYNLLQHWMKTLNSPTTEQELPETLSIAVFDHQTLFRCASAMMEILNQLGVKCQINSYSFDEFYRKAKEKTLLEDVILTSLDLDDNRPTSIFRWLLSNPILQQSLSLETKEWLQSELINIRNITELTYYLGKLEPVSSSLISDYKILPLFHHKQTLRFQDVLKGVSITGWGWPAIRDVWSED